MPDSTEERLQDPKAEKRQIRKTRGLREMDHLYDCGKWEKRSSSPYNEPLLPFPLQAHQLAQSPHTHPNAQPEDQLLDLLG
ncbi:MAG: hypothetical protein KAI86_06955, partial [Desulfobacterales bacterium]|nr:hypothetical protein [Desulfobacterales bacterium]